MLRLNVVRFYHGHHFIMVIMVQTKIRLSLIKVFCNFYITFAQYIIV